MSTVPEPPREGFERAREIIDRCRTEIARAVVGQTDLVSGLLTGIIAGGHVLLEGVPGLAKTLTVKTIADCTGLQFKRIQFTPDLLPADLLGTLMYRQASGDFVARKGPIFANVILADEINRAPAKVQSALLEAMEERQVTIGDTSYRLPDPFFVLATENPIEHEGTYPLPEAELDRFLLKVRVPYPTKEEEAEIVLRAGNGKPERAGASLSVDAIAALQRVAEQVKVDGRIVQYAVSVVAASRPDREDRKGSREGYRHYIQFGASPRASIALYRCSRVLALMDGRSYVIPEDVKAVAYPALRHRLVLSYEAEAEQLDADDIIDRILSFVPVP
jgi:MoxR-like ATPase